MRKLTRVALFAVLVLAGCTAADPQASAGLSDEAWAAFGVEACVAMSAGVTFDDVAPAARVQIEAAAAQFC